MNARPQTESASGRTSRTERWQAALLLGVFLVFNLATASRYPYAWIDEVMFADPAVNLLAGQGFTSSAWYGQGSGEFFAGNVPLYSGLLFGWMKVFGFSITAVRSLSLVLMAAVCLLAWRAGARLGLVRTARARLLFLVLLLGGYSVVFSYRSGRYDALAMLVVAALFWAHSLEHGGVRAAVFFVLGMITPGTGMQLLPMLCVGGAVTLVFAGWRVLPQWIAAAAGACGGMGLLMAFYKSHGVWEKFLGSFRQQTSTSILGMLRSGEFHHSNYLPKDFSFWPVFALALLLAAWLLWRREFRWRSPLAFGLVFSVGLSLALVLGGKFPTYYGWMTYGPLCLCVCAALSATALPAVLRVISAGLLGLAMLVGFGLHALAAGWDWPERDHRKVEVFARQNLNREDWMCGDHTTYYAAKPVAARVFMPVYLPAMPDEERRRLTVLIIAPGEFNKVTNVVGGNWASTGARLVPQRRPLFGTDWKRGFLSMPNYELEVFRRDPGAR